MKDEAASMKPLRIWPILSEAISTAWRNRGHFLPLLIIPTIVFIVDRLIWETWLFPLAENGSRPMILSIFLQWVVLGIPYAVVFAIFAIACHRSILLGIHTVPNVGFLGWTKRETRFALLSIALAVFTGLMFGVCFFIAILVTTVCSEIFSSISQTVPWVKLTAEDMIVPLGYGIAILLIAYPAGRLSLLLPATAVDRQVSFQWAWLSSKPHDIRLVTLVGAIPICSLLLQDSILRSLERSLASVVYYALEAVLYCSLLVIEITILSICYREIENMKASASRHIENGPNTEIPA